MTLDVSLRPMGSTTKIELFFEGALTPNLSGIINLEDAEPFRRNRCRLIDYYSRCAAAESEALGDHLHAALNLEERPKHERC